MSLPSGKFVLRLPKTLHDTARLRAKKLGLSLNELCTQLITKGLDDEGAFSDDIRTVRVRAGADFKESFIGLILFGSQARGDGADSSDIDLLIVVDRSVALRRELYRWRRDEFDEKLSLHFAHLPENATSAGSLWLECALDGRILFDPRGEIRRSLKCIKDLISSGRVVRKTTHGQGYWVQT